MRREHVAIALTLAVLCVDTIQTANIQVLRLVFTFMLLCGLKKLETSISKLALKVLFGWAYLILTQLTLLLA